MFEKKDIYKTSGKKIYFDTNQIFFVRKIADEGQGWEFGDYSWASKYFKNKKEMVNDIKALCYIIALQYQWDLDFFPSDASYKELVNPKGLRTVETKNAFDILRKFHSTKSSSEIEEETSIKQLKLIDLKKLDKYLSCISDMNDRKIIKDFVFSGADVLLTSDYKHILKHKDKLFELGIKVMRPYEWISAFTKDMRGDEESIEYLERILFAIGSEKNNPKFYKSNNLY